MLDISGSTKLFPVIAWPVEQVKAPRLFNAWFAAHGIDARVVPMKIAPADYAAAIRTLMAIENVGGILISIPHKPATMKVVDHASERARLAGACNVIYRDGGGAALLGDLIDGEGFVRALDRTCCDQPFDWAGQRALIVGSGGVGCAIAVALAARGIGAIDIHDTRPASAQALCDRLRDAFPATAIGIGAPHAAGYGLVVNSTPLGMESDDPLPVTLDGIAPSCIVADCCMKIEMTPLLTEAARHGCRIQKGKEMLIEQAPLYLALFGWPDVPAASFRELAVL